MSTKTSIDAAGIPRVHHIYAVFDQGDDCRNATRDLVAEGLVPEELDSRDAPILEHAAAGAGIVSRLERRFKEWAGETHIADVYAHHLRLGRTVLAVRVPDTHAVEVVQRTMQEHGGYELTYFRNWGIEYMSPVENHAQHLHAPTRTNRDE